MSNGASIVLEQAAARPEASVFFRPSVMADDVAGCCCCATVVVDLDDAGTVATFALAHPPPLGTIVCVCTFTFDDALGEKMESFACEI